MTTIFWLAVAVFAFCVLFFGWERTRAWLERRKAEAEGAADVVVSKYDQLENKFKPEWGEVDDYVARARNLWPSLKSNPFFWAGVATSAMICVLGILGATALGQGVLILTGLWMCIFVVANLVQAAIAVLGDKGRGDWHDFQRGDRPAWHWPVLILLLGVNFLASITGSSNVAEVLQTTSEINASAFEGTRKSISNAKADLDALRTRRLQVAPGMSIEAVQEKATAADKAAKWEALPENGGCKSRCRAAQAEATKWTAIAKNALEEKALEDKIAVLRASQKQSVADGTARNVASPHADLVENVTGGGISKAQVNAYLAPIFWLVISVVDIALWLWAGDYAGRYRMSQYRIRAEAGNAWLDNAGLPPRYKIDGDGIVEDVKAIEDHSGGDSIHIDLSESARAKIEKSDRLKQIDNFFAAVMIEDDTSKIAIGKAYEIFARIRQEQGERLFMNHTDFRTAITSYCEIMGIELISNQIVGYKIGVTQHAEAAE